MRGHVLFPFCVSTSTSALLIMHISYLGAAGCDRRTGVNKTFKFLMLLAAMAMNYSQHVPMIQIHLHFKLDTL